MPALTSLLKTIMTKPKGKVVEGIFGETFRSRFLRFLLFNPFTGKLAINKPASISSAQAIRNLQHLFNPSALFAPWLAAERSNRKVEVRTLQTLALVFGKNSVSHAVCLWQKPTAPTSYNCLVLLFLVKSRASAAKIIY